jgi:hypothetical protein
VFVGWCIERLIAGYLDAAAASMAKWRCAEDRWRRVMDTCNFTAGAVTRHTHSYIGNASEMNLGLS